MSFSLSLQCFENGTFSSFERSIAYDIFGPHIHPSPEGLELWYNDQYGGTLYLDDQVEITGISINRPGQFALYGLYQLASLTPSLITWTDCCAVADAAFLPGMPKWLLDAFPEPPTIVHSGDELCAAIARN